MSYTKKNKLLPYARQLRREMTPQEKKLWFGFLRDYPVKFYKQRIIEHCIVDFYCYAAKLVLEIDGKQHYQEEGLASDAERTAMLEKHGLKVLRFANAEVDAHFDDVCQRISEEVERRKIGRAHV